MRMTAEQANQVFDIIVDKGNFSKDGDDSSYVDYKRSEFVESLTNGNGINEYWYSSDCGSSMKVYFNQSFRSTITFHAQTFNHIKEATVTDDMNNALADWMLAQS